MKNKTTIRITYSLIIFIGLAMFLSCSKNTTGTTPSSDTLHLIQGTAQIHNYYDNTILPFTNQLVFIRVDTLGSSKDTSNYFFSIPTDNNGNFSFYITNTTWPYQIFTEPSIRSSSSFAPLYYGAVNDSPYTSGKILQLMIAVDTTDQNGLNITTLDLNGEKVPGAQVYLYTSRIIAAADTALSGSGSYNHFKTDSLGRAFVSNLPAGAVYINAILPLASDTLKQQGFSTETIRQTGVTSDTLILK